MKLIPNLPSRSKCRFLWTKGDYDGIIKNYESNRLFRKLCISGTRELDIISIYLTALLNKKRLNDILKHKKDFDRLRESNLLPCYIELNKFAIDEKIVSPTHEMHKSYEAYQRIKNFKSINFFWRNLCSEKFISIVGNAPINYKCGDQIDSSDIVLRFNKFQTTGFSEFIGTKTDAWCRICDIRLEGQHESYSHIKHVIFTDNPLNVPVGHQFINEVTTQEKNFYYIPQEIVEKMACMLNSIPSSGARILISLHENTPHNKIKSQIYGFSFNNKQYNTDKFEHYFENKKEKERAHNIKSEVQLLRKMFSEEGNTLLKF